MIVIAFISSLSVEQCQASISNTVSPENHSKLTVLLMKKIVQNGSKWLHFSEKKIMHAYTRSKRLKYTVKMVCSLSQGQTNAK